MARQEELRIRHDHAIARQEEAQARLEAVIAGMGEQAKREEVQLAELVADRREAQDERRAMIEGLMRMIDRLPPARS